MERNQFWIFLGLGLAVGACLELMKAPASQPVRLAGFTHFETLLEEGKEVRVVEEVKPVVRRGQRRDEEVIVAQRIASNDTPTPEVMAKNDDPATPAASPTPKPLTPEEQKKKDEEDKKKKELEKKKKLKAKKKKEEEEKKNRETLEAQAKDDEAKKNEPKDDADAASPAADTQAGPAYAQRPPLSDDGLPKTVAEWEAYLMKDIDFERMAKFVKLFQTGVLKSEVFYPVIEAMLQDSRPGIRSLAVGGLSSTPSTQSYTSLLDIRNDADANVRKLTHSAVSQYSRLENLRYLMPVIVGQYDPSMVIEAMHTVKDSADSSVKTLTASSAGGTGTPAAHGQASTALARYFTPFVTALHQTSQSSHDANVRTAAVQAYAELQVVMASITALSTASQTTASNQGVR